MQMFAVDNFTLIMKFLIIQINFVNNILINNFSLILAVLRTVCSYSFSFFFFRGDVLVAKGVTKQGINLPEVGYKDVAPNGSWLERKQIQTALELRKQMLEVERIEKM